MRKVIVSTIVSLDGYCEGPGKDVLALPFDPGFSAYNLERLRAAETLLWGRTSFMAGLAYWPHVVDDQTQDLVEREISALQNRLEKLVVSDTLKDADAGIWSATTKIVTRAQARAVTSTLRQGDGGDIVIFGSRTMWNDLLVAGLVDELHVMVGPALLGAGTPVYAGSTPIPLQLLETRALEGSSLILARYAPS